MTATDGHEDTHGEMLDLDPLEMTKNAAHNVGIYAQAQERDPLAGRLNNYGSRGQGAAELAGHMGIASMAIDLRRLTIAMESIAADLRAIATANPKWSE